MRIAFVTPEMVPFCKTGGLADVAGGLTRALADAGNDVVAFLPRYKEVEPNMIGLEKIGEFKFPVYLGDVAHEVKVPYYKVSNRLTLALVEYPPFFDRDGLYQANAEDHHDNLERFTLFSRAACEALDLFGEEFEVVHLHDWQTALVAAYAKTTYASRALGKARIVFTIHNLTYQGLFPADKFWLLNLPSYIFSMQGIEFYGQLNIMKAGLIFSDRITTVSQRYSQEIQTPEFGAGLDGVLADRKNVLYGILNGIDYQEWNPSTDKLIPARYTKTDLKGKGRDKTELLKRYGFKTFPNAVVLGMVSRITEQKGISLVAEVVPHILAVHKGAHFIFLGTGDPNYEKNLLNLAKAFPKRVGVKIGFSNELAHLIEAGSDLFLMPSQFEPCGLNQMYSLKYGTVPIVRATGGLADTIKDADWNPRGNGFTFDTYNSESLGYAVIRALSAYSDKERFRRIVERGMAQDHSWRARVAEYMHIYKDL